MKYIFLITYSLVYILTETKCPYGCPSKHYHRTQALLPDTTIVFYSSEKAHKFYDNNWWKFEDSIHINKFDSILINTKKL